MKKIILILVVALMATTMGFAQCACCAGAGAGASNGYYNNGILTLAKKQWVAETYTDYRTINQSNAAAAQAKADEEEETPLKNMLVQTVGLRYGLTRNITLSALLPYVFLHTDTGNDSGLGDLVVMGTFTVFSKNNFNVALQAGLELPTGTQKSSAFDNTTVVVGSGSYDPMAGIVLAKRWNKLTLQANGLYKKTTSGFQGNYYSSIAIQNLSLNYKLKEGGSTCASLADDGKDTTEKPATANFGWSVFGGYYGEWLDKLKEDGVTDENSGYYMGYATMGTALSYKKWSFPITASLPVIQNMNGDQNDGGFRLRLGIIRSF